MRKQQVFLWLTLVSVIVIGVTLNNHSINNKVLEIGELESFVIRLMKTNLINSKLSYGAGCYEVTVNRDKQITDFKVLSVDENALEIIDFTYGKGYSTWHRGYVTKRGYIEYKDVNLKEIEAYVKEVFETFDLYDDLREGEVISVQLAKRLAEDAMFHYEVNDEVDAYIQGKNNRAFRLIEEDVLITKGAYRFELYIHNKGTSKYKSENRMLLYKYF